MSSNAWSTQRRGGPRPCNGCGRSAWGAPAGSCTEPRHAEIYAQRAKDAAASRRTKQAERKALGLTEAMTRRDGKSVRGRSIEPDLPGEVWVEVGRHRVSNLGRVRGCWGWLLRQRRLRNHYFCVRIPDEAGKKVTRPVHSLVCEAFHGPRPAGHQAAHNDGDIENNHSDNLRWATPLENSADKYRHGTMPRGEANGLAKLNAEVVRELRLAAASGDSHRLLAGKYGVAPTTVGSAISGRTWGHVT